MHPDFRDCLGFPLTSEYLLKIYIYSNKIITFLLWMLHPLVCSAFSSSLHGLLLCIIRHHPARLLQLTQKMINSSQYNNHLLPAIHKDLIAFGNYILSAFSTDYQKENCPQMNTQVLFITCNKFLVTNHTRYFQSTPQVHGRR